MGRRKFTLSNLTPEQRVNNGVQFFDRYYKGWRKKINKETLNIAYPQHCIIGQLFSEKWTEEIDYRGRLARGWWDHFLWVTRWRDYSYYMGKAWRLGLIWGDGKGELTQLWKEKI